VGCGIAEEEKGRTVAGASLDESLNKERDSIRNVRIGKDEISGEQRVEKKHGHHEAHSILSPVYKPR